MKKHYKKFVYFLIVSSFTTALYCYSIKNNDTFLAPKSYVENLFANEDGIDLHSLNLEQIKLYFKIKRPDFNNIQEAKPLNANDPLRIVREITYEIMGDIGRYSSKGRYDGPTQYIMYINPERELNDLDKLHRLAIDDSRFANEYFELYYSRRPSNNSFQSST